MKNGHWKLWHDVRGRFLVALLIVGWQIFATRGGVASNSHMFSMRMTQRPEPCRAETKGELSVDRVLAYLDRKAAALSLHDAQSFKVEAGNYRTIATYCGAGKRPTEDFATLSSGWMDNYVNRVWKGLMPLLMLFMGILLAVGPPFGGEANESSTLTFSLPWSRSRWLAEKVRMCGGLLVLLIAPAFMVSRAATSFPVLSQLHGTFTSDPLRFADALPSLLTGLIGIALGVSATMLTRNALVAAVTAAIAAYVLTMFNFAAFMPSHPSSFVLLNLGERAGVMSAFVVILGAVFLSWVRLRTTDY